MCCVRQINRTPGVVDASSSLHGACGSSHYLPCARVCGRQSRHRTSQRPGGRPCRSSPPRASAAPSERPIVDWKIKGCFSLNAEGDVNLDDNPLDADIVERVRDATDRTPELTARARRRRHAAAWATPSARAIGASTSATRRRSTATASSTRRRGSFAVWAKLPSREGDEEGGGEGQGAAFPAPVGRRSSTRSEREEARGGARRAEPTVESSVVDMACLLAPRYNTAIDGRLLAAKEAVQTGWAARDGLVVARLVVLDEGDPCRRRWCRRHRTSTSCLSSPRSPSPLVASSAANCSPSPPPSPSPSAHPAPRQPRHSHRRGSPTANALQRSRRSSQDDVRCGSSVLSLISCVSDMSLPGRRYAPTAASSCGTAPGETHMRKAEGRPPRLCVPEASRARARERDRGEHRVRPAIGNGGRSSTRRDLGRSRSSVPRVVATALAAPTPLHRADGPRPRPDRAAMSDLATLKEDQAAAEEVARLAGN